MRDNARFEQTHAHLIAMGDGVHMLPIKADIRQAIGKEAGDTVNVVLEERITTTPEGGSADAPESIGNILLDRWHLAHSYEGAVGNVPLFPLRGTASSYIWLRIVTTAWAAHQEPPSHIGPWVVPATVAHRRPHANTTQSPQLIRNHSLPEAAD